MLESWGNDVWTVGKVLELLYIISGIIFITFFATNIPELASKAQTFWWLGITSVAVISIAFVITQKAKLNFNVVLWGDGILKIPDQYVKPMLIGCVGVGLLTFFWISNTPYSVLGPSYDILDLDYWGNAFLSFWSAHQEDIFFFSVLPGIMFTVFFYITKRPVVAFLLILILSPMIFLIYHTLHYGLSDVVNSIGVLAFGVEQILVVSLLGNLVYTHMRHGFNNAGKIIFKQMTFTGFLLTVLTSWMFWVVVIVLVALVVIRKRGK